MLGPIAGIPLGGALRISDSSGVGTSLAQVVASRHIGKAFILLLTIEHDDLTVPIRVADDALLTLSTGVPGVISRSVEFVQLPFRFTLPNQESDSPPRAKIVVDNVSREITAALANISSPPTLMLEIVLSDFPDVVEISLADFKLETVSYDALTIEGDLTIEQFESEPWPKGSFLPSGFPGLFRGSVTEVGAL